MAKSSTVRSERREAARAALDRYRVECERLRAYALAIQHADSVLVSVTAQYDEMGGGGVAGDSIGRGIASLYESGERFRDAAAEAFASMRSVEKAVAGAASASPDAGVVLSMRYLNPFRSVGLAEIAERIGKSEDRAQHLHLDGLDLVADQLCRFDDDGI
ncbi:hypothetical protein GMI70_02905 [Eggerthellaceae bacterium zg-893]|nr:hypothetical protein [Eggerthellaceae bacterium zg-893]